MAVLWLYLCSLRRAALLWVALCRPRELRRAQRLRLLGAGRGEKVAQTAAADEDDEKDAAADGKPADEITAPREVRRRRRRARRMRWRARHGRR